jgi:hypothetical protein
MEEEGSSVEFQFDRGAVELGCFGIHPSPYGTSGSSSGFERDSGSGRSADGERIGLKEENAGLSLHRRAYQSYCLNIDPSSFGKR